MNDTDKKIDDIYREMLRKKTGEERLMMGFSMFHFSATLLLSSLRGKIPSKDLRKSVFLKIYASDFDKTEIKKISDSISP